MDDDIMEKFEADYGLTKSHIEKRELFFRDTISPAIKKRYLSHLVSTIEDLVNEKRKKEFLIELERLVKSQKIQSDQYKALKDMVNIRRLRMFSIMLAPIESGKLNARTHMIRGCSLITYWKDLPELQKRSVIAHELGHIINKHFFNDSNNLQEEGLATLFGYIAMCDKDKFYKNDVQSYMHKNDVDIYREITNLCKMSSVYPTLP